jgi:hypothetical protein
MPYIRQLRYDTDLLVLQLVAKAGIILADHVTERLYRAQFQDDQSARAASNAALRRLVVRQYVEMRPYAVDITEARTDLEVPVACLRTYFTQSCSVTSKVKRDFNIALPASMPESFVAHHFSTMDALWRAEGQFRQDGYEVVDWMPESALIRASLREKAQGVRRRSGAVVQEAVSGKYPDAVLVVRAPSGIEESVNVEVVSRHYTDEMIRAKKAGFTGRTIWAATDAATALRVQRITGEAPLLV